MKEFTNGHVTCDPLVLAGTTNLTQDLISAGAIGWVFKVLLQRSFEFFWLCTLYQGILLSGVKLFGTWVRLHLGEA